MSILTKFKDLTVESLKDNWKLIVGLYIIFIVCVGIAWLLSADRVSTLVISTSGLNSTMPATGSNVSAMELFINNEFGGIVTYIESVLFAIPSIVMLIYNAANLGAIGQLFSVTMRNGAIQYFIYLIPHGIFEITATVLESVAGILLFLFIWRFTKEWINTRLTSQAFEKTKKVLIQSIMIFIFSTILLVIAAPIEAYFSVPFSEYIVGLL